MKHGQNHNHYDSNKYYRIIRNVSLGLGVMPCREELHSELFGFLQYKTDLPDLGNENNPYVYLSDISC